MLCLLYALHSLNHKRSSPCGKCMCTMWSRVFVVEIKSSAACERISTMWQQSEEGFHPGGFNRFAAIVTALGMLKSNSRGDWDDILIKC